jgi:hypothetical protein
MIKNKGGLSLSGELALGRGHNRPPATFFQGTGSVEAKPPPQISGSASSGGKSSFPRAKAGPAVRAKLSQKSRRYL